MAMGDPKVPGDDRFEAPLTSPLDGRVMERLLDRAREEAARSGAAGGVPIGAVLVDRHGHEISVGRNCRFQNDDPTSHAELEALRAAGLDAELAGSVMATTMTPCWMCAGAIAYLGVSTLIVGDSSSFDTDGAQWLRTRGSRSSRSTTCVVVRRSSSGSETTPTSGGRSPASDPRAGRYHRRS